MWQRLTLEEFSAGRNRRLGYDLGAASSTMTLKLLVDPASKRRVLDWLDDDQVMPDGFARPELHHLHRRLDQLSEAKDELETHLWSPLTNLTNLDLSLVCYELTSTHFEGEPGRRSGSSRRRSATPATSGPIGPRW